MNPEEPLGLELKAEGLMAERKRRGHVLKSYMNILIIKQPHPL